VAAGFAGSFLDLAACSSACATARRPFFHCTLAEHRRMAAGFLAGVTEALVIVTPFEVVKIRLQQQKGMSKELLKYKVQDTPGGGGVTCHQLGIVRLALCRMASMRLWLRSFFKPAELRVRRAPCTAR
jgi:Mitochondrial carrier protein